MLILIHVAFVVHLIHWRTNGRTITPVEPSEAMQTLELGYVNAGFILFGLLILSTLIFGRFFCGWGCHLVALQDLCAWLLGKVGIRPKPIRSRVLVWVPTFAALYMFVWPQIQRIAAGDRFPELKAHLTTEEFWATFPGPGVAVFTFLVCGFAVVYFLGAKGFCTYGCPYGAIFYNADRFAPGKIRVTDACEGCGHCTAVCTSNVRVHEEVAQFGAVVDAGCMKCMDCVDACPNSALYFGFGTPTVGNRTKRAKRTYDFTWQEEAAMSLVFLLLLYALRGLYDLVPFLLALGAGVLLTFAILFGARLIYLSNVRFARLQLKSRGRLTRTGWAYSFGVLLLALLSVHSTAVQLYRRQGEALYDRGLAVRGSQSMKDAIPMLRTAYEIGLVKPPNLLITLASAEAQAGSKENAEYWLRKAQEVAPDAPEVRLSIARLHWERGEWLKSVEALNMTPPQKVAVQGWHDILGDSLVGLQRYREATAAYSKSASETAKLRRPLAEARALLKEGNPTEAVRTAEIARKVAPRDRSQLQAWAMIVRDSGQMNSLIQELLKKPQSDVETWYGLCYLYLIRGDVPTARGIFSRLARIDPGLPDPTQ